MSIVEHVDLNFLKGVIIQVPVGNLPSSAVKETLREAKDIFREIFPKDIKLAMIPKRGKEENYSFIILEN